MDQFSTHAQRPWLRPRRLLAVAALCVVLGLGLLAAGWFPQERVRLLVERRLQEAVGPRSRIGALHLVPGILSAEVRELTLEGPSYRIEVPQARARATLALVLRGTLDLRSLEADGARVTLRPPPPGPPVARPSVRIQSLRLTDATVTYDDLRLGGAVRVDDLDASGSIGGGTLVATARGGVWSRQPEVPLGPASVAVAVSPTFDLDVRSLDAGTPRSRIQGSGRVQTADPGALHVTWSAALDLGELAGYAPSAIGATGTANASGRLKGTLAAPTVAGNANWAARLLGGSVTGEASVEDGHVRARAHAEGLQTRRLPRSAAPENLPPSRVSGTVQAEGPLLGPWQVALGATAVGSQAGFSHHIAAQASGRVARETTRVDLEGNLRGTVGLQTATGPQDVAVQGRLRSAGPAVHASLVATGLGGSGQASLASHGASIDDLQARWQNLDVSPFAPGATGRLDGKLSASGPVDRLGGTGEMRVADLTWQGVTLGSATVELRGADGRGRARVAVPSLNVRGEAELDAQYATGRLDLAATPLAPFQPLMPGGRALEGTVTAEVDVRVPWRAPARATVDARVATAEVRSADLSAAATGPFSIAWSDRRVRLEGLEVEGEGLLLRASGSAGLRPNDALSGRVELHGDLATWKPPAPWTIEGTFAADAAISGTRAQPRLEGAIDGADVLVAGSGDAPLLFVPSARVDLLGDRISVADLQAEVTGGTLTAALEAPLSALMPSPPGALPSQDRLQAWFDIEDLDAGALFASLGSQAVPVDGTLSAHLSVEARPQGREIRGVLEAPATMLRLGDVSVELGAFRASADGASVVLDPWVVKSHGGEVTTQGRADVRRRTLEGTSRGRLDLRSLSPLLEQGALGGSAELDVAVSGSLDAPQASGQVTVADGTLRLREIPQALTDIHGRARLEGRRVRLEDVRAEWGGGTLALSGTAGLAADAPVDVRLSARDVSLRYPRDFRSRLRADLTLGGRGDALLLSGEVHAERGLYDTDIRLEETLLAPRMPPTPETSSSLLQAVALDLSVVTDRPILVRNNLAQLEASGRLRVRGDARFPAPFGRLDVREGGKIFLQTREFTIKNGRLTYGGTLDPEIALTAETVLTQIGDEDVHVTAVVSGPLERPTLDLRSDPSYTQREIASLIATGRRGVLDSAGGAAWAAGEHTAALLAGRFTRGLSRNLRDLGLDEVDIQPELLAREADPGARFTFGKLLTPQLKLIYSTGLNDPESRFFRAEYRFRLGREITAKIQREDVGTYSYGAGQRWRWGGDRGRGGGRRRTTDDTVTPTEVRVAGLPPELEERARGRLRVETGEPVTFWRLQDDAERVQELLRSAGYLEALVSADLEGTVAAIDVRPGARYAWTVEGLPAAPDLTGDFREALFEEEAIEKGRERLLEEAWARGHVKARVEAEVRGDEAARTVAFRVDLGPPAVVREVLFRGAEALSEGRLLEAAGGEAALLTAPLAARDRIVAAYRESHYLAARVGLPRVREGEDRSSIAIEVDVDEGPHALLAEVRFEGVTQDETALGDVAGIETGSPYDPAAVEDAVQRIRAHYLERGYASVRVQPRLLPRETDLDLVLRIVEGQQQFVGDVIFTGLRRTRESTVRRVVPFEKGDPLDPRALTLLERRLLDLDVFRRAAATASPERDATIRVEVREQGPYALQYDVRASREEGVSGLLDAEIGNVAGTALALGARYRAGQDIREARGSLHLPALGPSAEITASVFRRDENFLLLRESGTTFPFLTTPDTERQEGFQIQQSRSVPQRWDVLYGYRFKRTTSLTREFQQDLSSVEASLLRETRDNPLDAREGAFLSLSVELAPEFLGSGFQFFRVLGQTFFARPLGDSLTWAQGYRLGLANGLDEQVLRQAEFFGRSSEAFRAGGAHTLRGYATDSVGPPGPVPGLSRGGEALLVMNQEIRYRHPRGVGVAAFYDVGNVYREIRDLRSLKLRHSLGAGLRYESPVGLLRLDFGIPLNKRAADRSFQWFFSLGQAF